jgi:hypothetical protein
MVPSWPEARSPGPRGPDEFSPIGGRARRAARTSADMWSSCQRISSSTASGRSRSARPAALTAKAAAPSACAPIWQTATAWPAARAAAAAAGAVTSPAPTPPTNRRRISSAMFSSPRANARVRAMRARGRSSPRASASNSPRTRSAQSAAHAATRRRSASLSVCGDPTALLYVAGQPTERPLGARQPPSGNPSASIASHLRAGRVGSPWVPAARYRRLSRQHDGQQNDQRTG